jgi:hypothetical protein
MSHDRSTRSALWPMLIGLVAVVVLDIVVVSVAQRNNPASPIATPTSDASSTPAINSSPTSNLPPDKATVQAIILETQQAAAQTPLSYATVYPTSAPGPTWTPDISGEPQREAGAGIIISDTANFSGPWKIAVLNQWYEIPKGFRVYAGVTDDPTQGALAILVPDEDLMNPQVYLTPLKAGPVQVVDAQGERLVLRSLDGTTTFYFDVPTRQFMDSLTVTTTAPTVTPWPTYTATPTMQMPTVAPPPTAYPIASPSEATPAPTSQSTASP